MFTANISVTCSYPWLFNFIWWYLPCIWLGTTHPCNPVPTPLWSVGKFTFLHDL